MKMDIVAGSKNDEFYTPKYAVAPIVKYLKNKNFQAIWCPFDMPDSNFVRVLSSFGFEVINTHIKLGQDFFVMDNIHCDAIVSNPPYSIKAEVLQKLFAIGKPFAMLVGVVGLFESQKRFSMFANNEFEVMYLNKRVAYLKEAYDAKPSLNPPFSSVYLTSGVLPQQMCFEEINKKDI
jgi:hypothetical protein